MGAAMIFVPNAATTAHAVAVHNVSRTFKAQHGTRRALDRVSLKIRAGEMVALIGPSGSGKSTLLRSLAGLLVADGDSGAIEVGGRLVQQQGRLSRDIRDIRAGIGVIFQQFNLTGRLPVITNVMVGMISRVPLWRSITRTFSIAERLDALQALEHVGILDHAWQRSSTLSGGQQQRAAIARALVQRPGLILGDEPIASLDPRSCRLVMEAFTRINRDLGATVVVSLHQIDWAVRFCPRVIALRAGQVVYDGASKGLSPAVLRDIYGAEFHEAGGDDALGDLNAKPTMAAEPALAV